MGRVHVTHKGRTIELQDNLIAAMMLLCLVRESSRVAADYGVDMSFSAAEATVLSTRGEQCSRVTLRYQRHYLLVRRLLDLPLPLGLSPLGCVLAPPICLLNAPHSCCQPPPTPPPLRPLRVS